MNKAELDCAIAETCAVILREKDTKHVIVSTDPHFRRMIARTLLVEFGIVAFEFSHPHVLSWSMFEIAADPSVRVLMLTGGIDRWIAGWVMSGIPKLAVHLSGSMYPSTYEQLTSRFRQHFDTYKFGLRII